MEVRGPGGSGRGPSAWTCLLEKGKRRATEVEQQLIGKEQDLTQAKRRTTEAEQQTAGKEQELTQAKRRLADLAMLGRGVTYVGEGELARICKIAHNVFLGVVIENLAEITILAQKAGVPRHAFLDFMNASVLGSVFSKYKSNAFVNLDWTTTFTPTLLRKDLDLGLKDEMGFLPLNQSATCVPIAIIAYVISRASET